MDGGVLFKGITFSGHLFEMIIHRLAAGGAAALWQTGSIKVKWRSCSQIHLNSQCQCLAAAVSPATNIIPTAGKGSGHEGCLSDKQILSDTVGRVVVVSWSRKT